MPLARSFTQKLQSKITRSGSLRLRTPSTPSTPDEHQPSGVSSKAPSTDYFYSISFDDTQESTQKPVLGESFTYTPPQQFQLQFQQQQPLQNQPHSPSSTPSLSRAASLLSRKSSSSSKRYTMSRHNSESSTAAPSMTYSPSPSTSSFPPTPGGSNDDLHQSGATLEYFGKQHKSMPSHSSSCYSTVHSLSSAVSLEGGPVYSGSAVVNSTTSLNSSNSNTVSPAAAKEVMRLKALEEESQADELAMQILEKVTAQDYVEDIDTCFGIY